MVNISWEKGEGADMGTLGTLKEKTELPLHAPKPALDLKDRKQMQGCPEAGAPGPGWQDGLVEDSLAPAARSPLLILGGLGWTPRFGSQGETGASASSYREA